MENQIENVVQTASGSRNVREGRFRGVKVIVVAGFDIWTDDWPFHVYVQHDDGARSRVSGMPTQWRSASLEGAFEEGMRLAVRHLSPGLAGAVAAAGSQPAQVKRKVAGGRGAEPATAPAGGSAKGSPASTGAKAASPKRALVEKADSRGLRAPAAAKARRKADAMLDAATHPIGDGNGKLKPTAKAKAKAATKPDARGRTDAKAKPAPRAR